MKTKRVLLLIMALILVLSVASAQASALISTAAGATYQLRSLTWQVDGAAVGGAYRLTSAPGSVSAGSGCCCTYLPCVIR